MSEPFLLVSLEEAKTQKLASVLQNKTCTKLLNFLATKEATESGLAKHLKLPLSTVHYNLKQLVEAKLVIGDEYHYSSKGKEVLHYRLANKYIIIAPQGTKQTLGERLKTLLPAFLVVVGVAIALKVAALLSTAPRSAMSEAVPAKSSVTALETMAKAASTRPESLLHLLSSAPVLLAFLVGAGIALAAMLLQLRRKK